MTSTQESCRARIACASGTASSMTMSEACGTTAGCAASGVIEAFGDIGVIGVLPGLGAHPVQTGFALDPHVGACPCRRTGGHPRIKSESMLRRTCASCGEIEVI